MSITLSIWPLPFLERALQFQTEKLTRPWTAMPCIQDCGRESRCGGVCAVCLRAEIARRKAIVTEPVAATQEGQSDGQ